MNEVQIAIIVIVAVIVLAIIGYYIYQENKFKKLIESNFNQATQDVIQQDKGLIFENQESEIRSGYQSLQKDQYLAGKLEQSEISFDPLLDSGNLTDAALADEFFVKFDQLEFSFAEQINEKLDHIIDVTWTKPTKLKAVPEIGQFSAKSYTYYVLEKGGSWSVFEKGKKYNVEGIKLVISLVDGEGVITEFQLTNIYNELAKFALRHEGNIRQSDSLLEIRRIQQQLKALANIELTLGLYLVHKESLEFRHLAKYFESNGFSLNNGAYEYKIDNKVVFDIRDENMHALNPKANYRLLSINAKLHHQENPTLAVDKIFDFAEHYVQYFESRLLSTNKQLLSERDYTALEKQVSNYATSAKRQGIVLGSALIARVFP